MGTEVPKTYDSSGESDSNTDSENSSSSESSGSDFDCSSAKQTSASKPHFSVTSCDTGLRLKIAAIPARKVSPRRSAKPSVKTKPSETTETQKSKVKKKGSKLSDSSSSSESCSKCSSDSSSEDDLPLKIVSKTLPKSGLKAPNLKSSVKSDSDDDKRLSDAIKDIKASKDKQSASKTSKASVKKTKSDDLVEEVAVKKGRGRPPTKEGKRADGLPDGKRLPSPMDTCNPEESQVRCLPQGLRWKASMPVISPVVLLPVTPTPKHYGANTAAWLGYNIE